MSDTHGPIWIVTDPAKPYPDRRFDGVTPRAHWNPDPDVERILDALAKEHWPETPPLDPQQPTPTTEQQLRMRIIELEHAHAGLWQGNLDLMAQLLEYAPIVNTAREALADIDTVIGLWAYEDFHPLFELKRLYLLLTPPAPKWTATEAEE